MGQFWRSGADRPLHAAERRAEAALRSLDGAGGRGVPAGEGRSVALPEPAGARAACAAVRYRVCPALIVGAVLTEPLARIVALRRAGR
jgi:hypothetical protein